jgi:uncharacterized cupin superfamily protein
MPRIDPETAIVRKGSSYPPPFDQPCAERVRTRLGDAGGITDFGVNLLTLPPGAWSSQRHWHTKEDEFVHVIAGEVTLITDKGEENLRAGDYAAFPKGVADGHVIVNRSAAPATLLEVGTRSGDDVCTYSDIDMIIDSKIGWYAHKDGKPYPPPGQK